MMCCILHIGRNLFFLSSVCWILFILHPQTGLHKIMSHKSAWFFTVQIFNEKGKIFWQKLCFLCDKIDFLFVTETSVKATYFWHFTREFKGIVSMKNGTFVISHNQYIHFVESCPQNSVASHIRCFWFPSELWSVPGTRRGKQEAKNICLVVVVVMVQSLLRRGARQGGGVWQLTGVHCSSALQQCIVL